MIRFRLRERLADLEFREGRRITLGEVAEETGITRTTLSRIANNRGYNTTTDNLDALCAYFGCQVGDIAEYVQND